VKGLAFCVRSTMAEECNSEAGKNVEGGEKKEENLEHDADSGEHADIPDVAPVPDLETIQKLIAQAKEIRVAGNAHYARQQYEPAREKYSEGIALLDEPHRLLVGERLRADKARADAAEAAKKAAEEAEKEKKEKEGEEKKEDDSSVPSAATAAADTASETPEKAKTDEPEKPAEESEEKKREDMIGMELSFLYCNRAACFLNEKQWQSAVDDCTAAINNNKKNVKAYWRRADAREELHKYREALEDLNEVCKLDAEIAKQKTVKDAIKRIEPLAKKQQEEELQEVLGKLKQFGNMVLGKFGLSTDDFKMEKDPATGGYSLKFAKQGQQQTQPPPQQMPDNDNDSDDGDD